VSRDIPLEKAAARQRYWALSLAAFAAARGTDIVESPEDLTVGEVRIPSLLRMAGCCASAMRRLAMNGIPAVSIADLADNPRWLSPICGQGRCSPGYRPKRGGRDRWMTPYSNGVIMAGIEMNANVYETIARRMFPD